MKLGVNVYDRPGGRMIADWTYRSPGGKVTTNERGYESYADFIPMSLSDAFYFYDRPLPYIILRSGLDKIFEGRIESPAIVPGGLEFVALGYQRALSDLPYTALWSDSHYNRWRPITDNDQSLSSPGKYELDNNNRLYITIRQGESYINAQGLGGFTYAAPHNGQREIVAFSASYNVLLPTDWVFRLRRCNYDFTSPVTIQTITGNGFLQTGTISQTFAGKPRLIAEIYNNTGATYNNTSQTGVNYAELTSVRVRSATTSTIYASDIANDLAEFINDINPDQLQSNKDSPFTATTLDLVDALYEDQYPADILTDLLDQAVAGQRWNWSVWEDRRLRINQRGAGGKVWYTDVVNLNLTASIDDLINSAYGIYQNGYNEKERTATVNNDESIRAYGLTRRGVASERSQTQGEARRDLLLAERKDITPNSSLELSGLYNAAGASFPLWSCRAGDVMIVRNLPHFYSPTIEKIRRFYVTATSYDIATDRLTPTPELHLPDLAVSVGSLSQRSPAVNVFARNTPRMKE